MKKIIIYDVDGVIIRREKYFSQRFSEDYGVPLGKILSFFKKEFQLCLIGKADLKVELNKYLMVWGWEKSVGELLDYWFSNESKLNRELLVEISRFRRDGTKCYLATNNEKYRVKYILETLGLAELFDGSFASCDIGYLKRDRKFWKKVHEVIDNEPSDVFVIDDEKENLDAAKSFGFVVEQYNGGRL